ncbi:BnaCnng10440D [Brassica napus]|uniref:BnaCnng10440D protein n=1 Tax=Brassica napus TaxID=3708 RepID=A0A078HXC9_BRANA|nr:BnaCnng10440D [Brassica napus]
MSNPMLSEKWESSSKTTRRELKRRERKTWKKPIRISKLPSFTSDQIPVIFSGYTAESEDSSSSDMSDDSIACSTKSSEVDQASSVLISVLVGIKDLSKSVRRMKSLKVLRRQSTRKGGGLMKMRSMKRVTSHTLRNKNKKNLDLISREDLGGLLEPHYLRPTSSSASKNVQKNLQAARLKRMTSLRYKGLLKATCSSAMKGSPSSKKSDDVCNYRYCSLHGRPHSHAADDESGVVHVPSLKRFVSMRRKFLKRQKSVNRRLVLLKRSLSRKRGPADQESEQVADAGGETNQEVVEEEVSSWEICGSESESNGRSSETVMVDVDDNVDTVASAGRECVVQETKPEVMDDSDGRIDKDMEETVTGLDHDDVKVKSEENVGDNEEVCSELREEDGKKTENIWNDVWNDTVTLVKQAFDEILAEITDDDSSDDASEGELVNEYDDVADDSSAIEGRDTHLTVIVSTSRMEEGSDHRRGAKKWSFLKRVILLKRFLKSLDRKERRKRSDPEENETIMRLRRELVGERKNAEEWMLDHALRQVIKTLAPPQRRKVKHLVKAFESLIPMNGSSRGHGGIGSPGREEKETMNSQTILRDIDDTTDLPKVLSGKDLEETNLTREVSSSLSLGMKSDEDVETIEDSSSSHQPAVEEVLDELASGSSIEEKEEKTGDSTIEEKTGDSEKKNLSTWRNLIQKHMVSGDNEERKVDEAEQEDYRWSYGTEDHGDAAAATIKSFQQAFEMILSEIPDDEEIVPESSNSLKEEKEEEHGETKRSWNSLRKVILLKRFVKSLEKVNVFNPRKLRNLPVVDSKLEEAENVILRRHRSTMEEGIRTDEEEWMLDYAMRQALSRLAPVERKKVELLVQAFDTVLDGHETLKQTKSTDTTVKEGTQTVEEDSEVSKDEQRIKNVFSKFQVHPKNLKQEEEEVDSTPRKSSSLLPPIGNVKQRIIVEKEKDSRMWKLIYKHMVTEKEEETSSVDGECDDDETANLRIDARRSGTVTLVREALEKILSEIPDNSSDDQSIDSATDQELMERNSQVSEEFSTNSKPKKGWNNVKKVILLKRFVSDLGRLSPKTPRFLPWEPDPETEKIRLRHQEVGGKRNSEEWMLDYALRQAISTLPPSQRRKVSLLAQAFDTISFSSTPATSRNISRQSSLSSIVSVQSENEGNAEILRGKLRKLQEDNLKETAKVDGDLEEKQECSSLWRLLCKQMEDNERNQTLPKEEQESEEDTSVDGEKVEVYKTEAVELLGEVIDGISLEESQKSEASQVKINRWSSLKKAMQLRKFVKALENVRKFNPREPRFLPLDPGVEAERVNLRHQETRNKRNGDEWMVDNSLQEVVSKLTPARRDKVKLLVQAFESLSATGN